MPSKNSPILICQRCDTEYRPHRPSDVVRSRFCSNACRVAQMHDNRRALKPVIHCEQCGTAFQSSPSAKGKYCSRACYDIAQKNSADYVFSRVDQSGGPTACWNWTGPTNKWGYGSATRNRRAHNAHRLAFIATHGEVADGLVIMHLCDNRLCCNPAHLKAGTQKENIADMDQKGRRPTRSLTACSELV
jgi:hypothetical protein